MLLTIVLNQLNVFKYNKLNTVDNNPDPEVEKPEVIFSIEKNYKDNENKSTDISKMKTDYHKYDIEPNTKWIKNLENMDENFPNINYQMIVNGQRKNLHAIQINNETYINIKELQKSLNHLNVHIFDDDKIISIYESSGLGIIECDGEEYIEYGDIMRRYSIGKNHQLPYIALSDHRSVFDPITGESIIGFPKKDDFSNRKYFYSLFIKKKDILEQLPLILKVICTNELYIKEYPESIYDK